MTAKEGQDVLQRDPDTSMYQMDIWRTLPIIILKCFLCMSLLRLDPVHLTHPIYFLRGTSSNSRVLFQFIGSFRLEKSLKIKLIQWTLCPVLYMNCFQLYTPLLILVHMLTFHQVLPQIQQLVMNITDKLVLKFPFL